MIHREPSLPHTIVDGQEYVDRIPDRVPIEDLGDPNEVYVFYAPILSRLSRSAIRAYVSFDVAHRDPTGMKVDGTLSFRDDKLALLGTDGVFDGTIIGGFTAYNPSRPIVLRRHGFKVPVASGILVRGDETFEDELAEVKARLDLERGSELITS
jgi:hypothetical protein